MLRSLALLLAAALVCACGGGDTTGTAAEVTFASAAAPGMPAPLRAALAEAIPPRLAAVAGTALTATQALDWAEANYANLFPLTGKLTGFSSPYSYRYYPATDTYLGVATAAQDIAVFMYGRLNGWQMIRLGSLTDFTCTIKPASCIVGVSPAAVTASAYEGAGQQQTLDIDVPPVPGTLSVSVSNSPAASWLSAEVAGSATVRLTASAANVPAGSYQGSLIVQFVPSVGPATTKMVPVAFSVGAGMLAPAAQQRTLNATTTVSSLSGAVTVARADGNAQAWGAASSKPWLVVTTPSGTTPSTLSYSFDAGVVASLTNFADHTATIAITSAGVSPVSVQVTLSKRLPYLTSVMPYGIPAGSSTRIVVRGVGLSQYAGAPIITGITATNAQVQSDNQMTFTVTPVAEGTYPLRLANTSGGATPAALLKVAAADPYEAGSAAVTGDKTVYIHDPIRQAIYALSNYLGNAVYKYQRSGAGWTTTALAVTNPYNMGLSPDGSRLYVGQQNAIKAIDPDTMTVVATYPVNFSMASNYGSPLAASVDQKLWLPGGIYVSTPAYLDLTDNAVKQPASSGRVDTGAFIASGDGSLVLVSPDYCCTPQQPWHLYKTADGAVTGPMGSTQFWYDPRLNTDGSRLVMQYSGALYDAGYNLMGQLPDGTAGDFWARLALTPDGSKILVLAMNGGGLVNRIDIYSTTSFQPGTTRFAKTGSIPVALQSYDCGSQSYYGCEYGGKLLPSHDGRAVFWIGNKLLQVFKVP